MSAGGERGLVFLGRRCLRRRSRKTVSDKRPPQGQICHSIRELLVRVAHGLRIADRRCISPLLFTTGNVMDGAVYSTFRGARSAAAATAVRGAFCITRDKNNVRIAGSKKKLHRVSPLSIIRSVIRRGARFLLLCGGLAVFSCGGTCFDDRCHVQNAARPGLGISVYGCEGGEGFTYSA